MRVGADDAPPAPPGAPVAAAPFVPSAERGYRWLTTKAYVPSSFTEEDVAALWTVWPAPARSEAERASPEERRRLTFARYGFTPRPDDPTKPLQYVVDEKGRWSMSCFACHARAGGRAGVAGAAGTRTSRSRT